VDGTRRVFPGEPGGRSSVALGRLWRADPDLQSAGSGPSTPEKEADRVASAFATVEADLAELSRELRDRGDNESADIVVASRLIASDPDLRSVVDGLVAAGGPAESAVVDAAEHYASVLAGLPDPTLSARSADVRGVGRRLLHALGSAVSGVRATPDGPLIVVAREVTADDLLRVCGAAVGAASVLGGATGHAAIVARGLGIPIVFGMDVAVLAVAEGTELLVDGGQGRVVVDPKTTEREAVIAAAAGDRARRESLAAQRSRPTRTRDGRTVQVLANVGSSSEAEVAAGMGADGIGLLRTEVPFLGASRWPSVADHVAALEPTLRPFAGRTVTVRTMDFAPDKLPPFVAGLGVRAAGPSLVRDAPERLGEQLEAILVAASDVDLRVMIPMVATASELDHCRTLLATAAARLGRVTPPLGAMIELPEAVEAIDAIVASADFVSIGTNDLTASILRIDRHDPWLTPARTLEPAVLSAIRDVVAAADRAKRSVSVCGDAASEPAVVPALIGLGCTVLSAAAAALDEVRDAVRSTSYAEAARSVEAMLTTGAV